jgi:hypothetical protein
MVPNGQLQFCDVGTEDGISAMLVCAGADVNADVFPKERPGYKLLHIAACSGDVGDLQVGLPTSSSCMRCAPTARDLLHLLHALLCNRLLHCLCLSLLQDVQHSMLQLQHDDTCIITV